MEVMIQKEGEMVGREDSIEFLNNLLDAIEYKRQLSIKEFMKTDLNHDIHLEDFKIWYQELVGSILCNPPKNYVKNVYIEEKDEHVSSVTYEYSDEIIVLEEISFVIHF